MSSLLSSQGTELEKMMQLPVSVSVFISVKFGYYFVVFYLFCSDFLFYRLLLFFLNGLFLNYKPMIPPPAPQNPFEFHPQIS